MAVRGCGGDAAWSPGEHAVAMAVAIFFCADLEYCRISLVAPHRPGQIFPGAHLEDHGAQHS